jgi:hypothetical protein
MVAADVQSANRSICTFVSTGQMFLQGFDCLYDTVSGHFGYSWPGRTDPMYGSVATGR